MRRSSDPRPGAGILRLFAALTTGLCLAPVLRVQAQSVSGREEDPAIARNREAYTVAFTLLDVSESSAGQGLELLAASLPLVALRALESLPPRYQDLAYRTELAGLTRERALSVAAAAAFEARDALAAAGFSTELDPAKRRSSLEQAAKRLAESQERRDALMDEGSAGRYLPPDRLATELWPGHAGGSLARPGKLSAAAFCAAQGIDLLVTGRLVPLRSYVAAEFSAFDARLGREVLAFKDYGSSEDAEPLGLALAEAVEAWLLGHPYARVDVVLEPRAATLRVDGRAESARRLYRFGAGSIRLEAEAPGHAPLSLETELRPGEHRSLRLELAPLVAGRLLVESEPPGALVSVDSEPRGFAPLEIELDGRRRALRASAPEREASSRVLPAEGFGSAALSLREVDALGPEGRFRAARDDFYAAFGWALLSLPFASLSVAGASGYAEALDRLPAGQPGSRASLETGRNLSYAALGLSGAALAYFSVTSIIKLVAYIAAAGGELP